MRAEGQLSSHGLGGGRESPLGALQGAHHLETGQGLGGSPGRFIALVRALVFPSEKWV